MGEEVDRAGSWIFLGQDYQAIYHCSSMWCEKERSQGDHGMAICRP